jgi:hypothetical protein
VNSPAVEAIGRAESLEKTENHETATIDEIVTATADPTAAGLDPQDTTVARAVTMVK